MCFRLLSAMLTILCLVAMTPAMPDSGGELSVSVLNGQANAFQVTNFKESADRVTFNVDSRNSIRLVVRPRQFQVRSGEQYSVNTSYYDPFFVRAEKDGELSLELAAPRNCNVVIEPESRGNLVPNASFEDMTSDGKAAGWTGRLNPKLMATMQWGHESIPPDGLDLPTGTLASVEAAVTEKTAHTGMRSFMMKKGAGDGCAELMLASPLAVEPGRNYLVSFYYKPEDAGFGSQANIRCILTAPGRETQYVTDSYMSPMYLEAPGDGWLRTFVNVRVPADYANAELMLTAFTVGRPFTLYIDDFEVRIAPSPAVQESPLLTAERRKGRFSAQEVRAIMQTRPAVKVDLPIPGKNTFKVNGRIVPLFTFVTYPNVQEWEGLSNIKTFEKSGVRWFWIPTPGMWLDDGKYDFKPLEDMLIKVLAHDPDAVVMLYTDTYPYRAFGDKHPEARWVNAFGQQTVNMKEEWKAATVRKPGESWNLSMTAPSYREECAKYLHALGRWIATNPLGKTVVGANLSNGADGQWFVPGWGRDFGDYDLSEGNVQAFRSWLRRKYRDDLMAFRKAWGDPKVTFETASHPKESERAPQKYLLDPRIGADQRLIDANIFTMDGRAESVNLFCKAIKEGVGRPFLTSTYWPKKLHGLHAILEDSYLDCVVGVMEYGSWRPLGRTGHNESSPDSLRIHDKVFLTETDFRTEFSSSWGQDANQFRKEIYMTKTPEEAANQLRRDVGDSLAHCQGDWIYSLSGNSWPTDEHVEYLSEIDRAAWISSLNPWPEDRGQIAVFSDEKSVDLGSQYKIYGPVIWYVGHWIPRMSLNRSGLSWDDYLLEDLQNRKRPSYKVNLFLSAATITPEQIEWVKKNLQKDGNVLIFVNNAGYLFGDWQKNIRELTGMTVKADMNNNMPIRLRPIGTDSLSNGAGNLETEYVGPLFYVDDPTATPVATIPGTEKTGIAVKRFANWTSIYISPLGGFSPTLLRSAAKEAGITPAGPEDDATYAGNGFITIHALKSGQKTIHWKGKCDLFDITAGTIVAKSVDSYSFPMKAWETRWFRRVPAGQELRLAPK